MVSSAMSTERPSWRGWLHAVAFACAIPAGGALIAISDRPAARASAALYALSLITMLGCSAAYHRLAKSDSARRRMQRLDHAGIFGLIAGTYVPITMLVLPAKWGIPTMIIIGGASVVGVVIKLAAFERLRLVGYLLYPIMGWAAVIVLPLLIAQMTTTQLVLTIAGGVVYTAGIPVLVMRRPDPWPTTFGYHEIWHSFVVVAAGLHFAAVASIVA